MQVENNTDQFDASSEKFSAKSKTPLVFVRYALGMVLILSSSFGMYKAYLARPQLIGVFVLAMMVFGLCCLLFIVCVRLLEAVEVDGHSVALKVKRRFGSPINISYTRISGVYLASWTGIVVHLRLRTPAGKLLIAWDIKNLGELVELILDRAENLEHVDLRGLPEKPFFYQKEPNWQIINRAMARAKVNAGKAAGGLDKQAGAKNDKSAVDSTEY